MRFVFLFSVLAMSLAKELVVFVGNPGSGKSTLLNGILGEVKFESGASGGEGLTKLLQFYENQHYRFGDTPGLYDLLTRLQAASEISQLFKTEEDMKLVFVVKLDSGRVRADDIAMIDVILNSLDIANLDNRFSVVFNQISGKVAQDMMHNEKYRDTVLNGLLGSRKTEHIEFVEFDINALDKTNFDNLNVDRLTEAISKFPKLGHDKTKVKAIDMDTLGMIRERHASLVKDLNDKIAVLQMDLNNAKSGAKQRKKKGVFRKVVDVVHKFAGDIANVVDAIA